MSASVSVVYYVLMFRNKVESLRSDLSAALAGHRVGMAKAVQVANDMLIPAETVQAVASANGKNGAGVLVMTDMRLIHVVKLLGQVKTESIRLDNVSSLETSNKPTVSLKVRHGQGTSKFNAISNVRLPAAVQAYA
jgi:hypothetical protein